MYEQVSDDLFELYSRHFEVIRADSPELLEEAYRLRYHVYCLENAFESVADHRDERESDEFDEHSAHSLLMHRASRTACGTVRLILPDASRKDAFLPIYRVGAAASDVARRLPRGTTAEVSRFAVSKAFRRRLGEAMYPDTGISTAGFASVERRMLQHITYGLIRAVALMSHEHGITHLCALMEPTLIRLLARSGLYFRPAGPIVQHHGLRQPCFSSLADLAVGLQRTREEMWAAATDGGRLFGKIPRRGPSPRRMAVRRAAG